jgi:Protein of unknown function (DUF1573)
MKRYIELKVIGMIMLSFIAVVTLFCSCHTETKIPSYNIITSIREQNSIDSSLKTTIVISPKKYFYKTTKNTNKVEGQFSIKNTGRIDFNIVAITSNCDCIKTTYKDVKVIPPGDSLTIKYEMTIINSERDLKNSIIAIGNCQFGNQTYYFEGSIF